MFGNMRIIMVALTGYSLGIVVLNLYILENWSKFLHWKFKSCLEFSLWVISLCTGIKFRTVESASKVEDIIGHTGRSIKIGILLSVYQDFVAQSSLVSIQFVFLSFIHFNIIIFHQFLYFSNSRLY